MSGWASSIADAFLARCAEPAPPEPERPGTPPDAVWALDDNGDHIHLTYEDKTGAVVAERDMRCTYRAMSALLAGRDRVKLEVRVVEDEA